jgi:hypothetical protein
VEREDFIAANEAAKAAARARLHRATAPVVAVRHRLLPESAGAGPDCQCESCHWVYKGSATGISASERDDSAWIKAGGLLPE